MPNFYNLLRARKFSTAADTALEIAPFSSATPNFVIEAGGKLKWSSGSANADTTLYRSAANTLKTDDSFDVASGHTYKIDGADVITATSLGSGVTHSHLTSIGNLTSLTAATPNFTGPLTSSGLSTFSNEIALQQIKEKVTDGTISANVLTCDYATGAIFYTSATANFTLNITNLPVDNGNAMTITVVTSQGGTAGYPNVLQVGGSVQTIKWPNGNTAPSPNINKIDIFTFTLIRRSSAWTVLGSYSLNY